MNSSVSQRLQKAQVDPEAFIAHEFAWYDGSIRAMDVEIGRLLEGLEARGLADKTLVAFVSDHGEEFLDHGYLDDRFQIVITMRLYLA